MTLGERIDKYERQIGELNEHPAYYAKDRILLLEILLDILRELVRQRG